MARKIVAIETFRCLMPKRRTWSQHGIENTSERRLLLRLRTDDGIDGWGEAVAESQWGGLHGRYFGETSVTVEHLIHDLFAKTILNSDPTLPRATIEKLDAIAVGHPYAKAAVEMALQDIRGKIYDEPLYKLLGGAYRSGIRIGHMLGLMTNDDALEEARIAIDTDQITAFQIKGGTDPIRDAKLIALLRRSVPETVFLRLDANKGYGKVPKEAADAVRRLADAGASAVEQPAATVAGLRACRAAVNIPIIADEGCWSANDVLDLWRAEAVDAVSIYVSKSGGCARASETASAGALVGFRCDVNGSLESGIGTAASMHVAMAAETLTFPSIISIPSRMDHHLTSHAGRYWNDDVVERGFEYRSGFLYLTGDPGLGVTVNEGLVEKYAESAKRVSRT